MSPCRRHGAKVTRLVLTPRDERLAVLINSPQRLQGAAHGVHYTNGLILNPTTNRAGEGGGRGKFNQGPEDLETNRSLLRLIKDLTRSGDQSPPLMLCRQWRMRHQMWWRRLWPMRMVRSVATYITLSRNQRSGPRRHLLSKNHVPPKRSHEKRRFRRRASGRAFNMAAPAFCHFSFSRALLPTRRT